MSNISQMTPYTKVKQSTDHDSRNFGPLVSGYEPQVSTLSQTVINLSQFVCDLSRKSNIMVFIDGQLLTEGVGNDYVWSAGINNTSNQLTLAAAIPAGLNIQIYKIGATQSPIASADTIQAAINLVSNQVDQKNSNKIINGGFDYWQRGTSFAAVAGASYVADRFQYFKSGAMIHTISRSTDVPSTSNSPYSMLVDCTTADASIAAGDFCQIDQRIEGNVLRSFKGKSMVLAFWVKSPKTGVHCIGFRNSALTRSLVKEYTVNVADTWERKVIRIQHDPTGTWLYDTGAGLVVTWGLAIGSTYQTTANTWQAGNFTATSNQVNVCDNTANNFYLSDIVFVEDNDTLTKVPDFCFAGRDCFEEFNLCQRYFEKSYNADVTPGTVTSNGEYIVRSISTTTRHQVEFMSYKRVNSSMTYYNAITGGVGTWRDVTAGANIAVSTAQIGQGSFAAFLTVSSGGNLLEGHWTADAEL